MGIILTMAVGHMAKKALWRSMKKTNEKQNENVLMEKLGVRTIDEFMRKDMTEFKEHWAKENGL